MKLAGSGKLTDDATEYTRELNILESVDGIGQASFKTYFFKMHGSNRPFPNPH